MYDWDRYRPHIINQYVTLNKSLDNVRQYMKDTYTFEASHRAYHMRFKDWNIQKRKRVPKKPCSTSRKPSTLVRNRTPARASMQGLEIFDNVIVAVPHLDKHIVDVPLLPPTTEHPMPLSVTLRGRPSVVGHDDLQTALHVAVCEPSSPEILQPLLDRFNIEHPLYDEELNLVNKDVPRFIRHLTQRALDLRRESWPADRIKKAKVLDILTSHEAWTRSLRPVDSLFEDFLMPMTSDSNWYRNISDSESACIAFFLSRLSGEDCETSGRFAFLNGPSLNHFLLFHTPGSELSTVLINNTNLAHKKRGTHILHEILDTCKHDRVTTRGNLPSNILATLLEGGVDPDLHDANGFTALTKLLQGPKNLDTLEYLRVLLKRADPALRDLEHRLPLQLAIRNFGDPIRSQLVEGLLSARSDGFNSLSLGYEAPRYFPISAQWHNYLSPGFKQHMQTFVSPDNFGHVVRAAVSISTRKALVENTSRDDFIARLELILDARNARKIYGLPDFLWPDSFVSKLMSFGCHAAVSVGHPALTNPHLYHEQVAQQSYGEPSLMYGAMQSVQPLHGQHW